MLRRLLAGEGQLSDHFPFLPNVFFVLMEFSDFILSVAKEMIGTSTFFPLYGLAPPL